MKFNCSPDWPVIFRSEAESPVRLVEVWNGPHLPVALMMVDSPNLTLPGDWPARDIPPMDPLGYMTGTPESP